MLKYKMKTSKILKNKKAISEWVSWVLLVAFMVAMGAFMYSYFTDYASSEGEKIRSVVYDTALCENVRINIDFVCQDVNNTQNLYINCTNKGQREINQVIINLYDLYGNSQSVHKDIRIEPQRKKEVTILKQYIQQKIEVIPVVYEGEEKVICSQRMVQTEELPGC